MPLNSDDIQLWVENAMPTNSGVMQLRSCPAPLPDATFSSTLPSMSPLGSSECSGFPVTAQAAQYYQVFYTFLC